MKTLLSSLSQTDRDAVFPLMFEGSQGKYITSLSKEESKRVWSKLNDEQKSNLFNYNESVVQIRVFSIMNEKDILPMFKMLDAYGQATILIKLHEQSITDILNPILEQQTLDEKKLLLTKSLSGIYFPFFKILPQNEQHLLFLELSPEQKSSLFYELDKTDALEQWKTLLNALNLSQKKELVNEARFNTSELFNTLSSDERLRIFTGLSPKTKYCILQNSKDAKEFDALTIQLSFKDKSNIIKNNGIYIGRSHIMLDFLVV